MRNTTDDGVPRTALSTTPWAATINVQNTALDHRAIQLDLMPSGVKSTLVESAEPGPVRSREGSVGHVEIFWLGDVGVCRMSTFSR